MITFENLSFSYGNTGEEQLNSLDLQIKKGEFVLLCGRSACGKTTATKCINGLIPHFTEGKYSGSVVVKEKEIAKTPVYEISEDVGSVFQNPKTQFFNLDSDSELVFGMENLGIEPNKINARVQEVAHGLKIENLLGRSVFGLSGGEKQILALASIYAVNPDIYVLDEPTANIDKDGIDRLHEILLKLKQMGKTIVISEHRLYFLMDLVDKAVYIEHGVIQKVYTGDEFRALADSERIRLGLRCFTLDNEKDEVPTKCNSGILEIDNLSVSYKNRTIFSNASFAAARGDIIAVTGRNGSGKSAFLRVLCGLMKEKAGRIVFDGKPYPYKKRRELCYMTMQDVVHELAMRFTKGKYAFIVATHTDREHIHNHIIYNSTALDSIRKFRDFLLSGLAVQRLSDLICLEHQLSVIEIKPYRERQKRTLYPPKESNRDRLCGVIDTVLAEKPKDYEDFLQGLEQQGYEVKRGKYTSVKGARQKRFIRFRTLGAGYSEEELKAVISGEAEHHPRQKQKRIVPEQKFQMLVDIQAKLAEGKSMGYARWAKRYNLKEMSKTLIFLQEHKIGSIKEMQERVDAATARYHELGDSIKAAEARMTEIAVLRTHIVNYARTRPVYDAYRKAGYSKRFLEAHREEITLHKAAKAAFDEAGLKKLPKTKDLSIEYAELLKKKKEAYPDYRKAQDEMQELMKAQKNVEMFFAEEKDTAEKEPTR